MYFLKKCYPVCAYTCILLTFIFAHLCHGASRTNTTSSFTCVFYTSPSTSHVPLSMLFYISCVTFPPTSHTSNLNFTLVDILPFQFHNYVLHIYSCFKCFPIILFFHIFTKPYTFFLSKLFLTILIYLSKWIHTCNMNIKERMNLFSNSNPLFFFICSS